MPIFTTWLTPGSSGCRVACSHDRDGVAHAAGRGFAQRLFASALQLQSFRLSGVFFVIQRPGRQVHIRVQRQLFLLGQVTS